MTALDTLRALMCGATVQDGILGACRLESGNVESFGVEAVIGAFRRSPVKDVENCAVVAAPGHLALFNGSEAVVADLFGKNVGRLWRIGQPEPGVPEPAVGVPFDTDLQQIRANVFFSAHEHPALDPAAVGRVAALGRALTEDPDPHQNAFRARAFALRAFGDAAQGCALFAIQALAAQPIRTPRLAFAAVRWDKEFTQIVRDPSRARDEHVRIVA